MTEHERIETARTEHEWPDPNGDVSKETRIEYTDGTRLAEGRIEAGPSKGHAWVKGEGGQLDGEINHLTLGGHEAAIRDVTPIRWGAITAQGENPKKPEAGVNWLHASLRTELALDQEHPDADLEPIEGVDEQNDDQGRPIYRKVTTGSGKVMVQKYAYHDAEGIVVMTGRHIDGPEKGKAWETREALTPDGEFDTGATYATPRGTIAALRIKKLTRDLAVSEAQAVEGKAVDPNQFWVEMHGDWKAAK